MKWLALLALLPSIAFAQLSQPLSRAVADSRYLGQTIPVFKSYAFSSPSTGKHYVGGFLEAPVADADLTNASATVVLGSADDEPWGAHAFVVCAGDGATDGSDLVLTVTGTSVTDLGVRTNADSEVVLADALAAACAENGWAETAKKWVGQVTFTLSSTGGTTFNWTGNYGFSKYEDFGNRAFTLTDFECTGSADANTTINIELIHYKSAGWDYDATAFSPGPVIYSLATDYSGPENGLTSGKPFAYKRASLATAISGNDSEGTIIRVTVGANNAVEYMSCHVGVTF